MPKGWLGEAANEIVDHFGAASFERQKIEGRWRFKGVVYHDVLARLVVDVIDTLPNRRWMRNFKAKWKERLKQIDIWVVSYRIDVE